MPRPSERTRSRKRAFKPSPGGKMGTRLKNEIGAFSRCISCGRQLAGLSNSSSLKTRMLNKGKKSVWRPYGGQLCHNCLKVALKQAAKTL